MRWKGERRDKGKWKKRREKGKKGCRIGLPEERKVMGKEKKGWRKDKKEKN